MKEKYNEYYRNVTAKPIRTKEEAELVRVWDVVYNAALSKTGDREQAVAEAERISGLVRNGQEYDEHYIRKQERLLLATEQHAARQRRANRIWRWKRRGGWALVWATLATLVGAFIWSMFYMEGNDYAGFDQKYVNGSARDELVRWYGEERLPEHKIIVAKERSHFFEQSAWKVKFRLPGADGIVDDTVCVFIWDGSAEEHDAGEVAVREGARC